MNTQPANLPQLTLPPHINIILHMLKEEIKHRAVTNAFEKLGMDTANFSCNLSEVVLAMFSFDERDDDLFDWYFEKLDHYAELDSNSDRGKNNQLVFEFYVDIAMKRSARYE